MPTNTTTYSLQKPTVGGDEDAGVVTLIAT